MSVFGLYPVRRGEPAWEALADKQTLADRLLEKWEQDRASRLAP
jgi:hypothetical protein